MATGREDASAGGEGNDVVSRRPTLPQIEAAARILFDAGQRHHWWQPFRKSYDEMAASDPIAKEEFDGLVERMLMAAGSIGD